MPIMIRLLVREIAEREGIQNPYQLADRTGLKYESCRLIWQGASRQLSLRTIEVLCRTLMIMPGQLFELVPRLGEPVTEEELLTKSKTKKRTR
jgi:DNA-binding Xre family transcriptional regulator